jgi:hypothetical protein
MTPGNKTSNPAGEDTPLLLAESTGEDTGPLGDGTERAIPRVVSFRRTSILAKDSKKKGGGGGLSRGNAGTSLRGVDLLFPSQEDKEALSSSGNNNLKQLEPIDALAPLVAGGVIVATNGYKTGVRPPSSVKALPAYAPFLRRARHRSFALWWINEFRHWWKSRYVFVVLYCTYCVYWLLLLFMTIVLFE